MGVRAQLEWKVIHTDQIGSVQYIFNSISCAGNNCTAGLSLVDIALFQWTHVFYQSTDGGLTWFSQTPDVVFPKGFLNTGFRKIQRIDSLNIVAISDSGFIIRTFNAGETWERQYCPTPGPIMDIHFSDPLTGILTIGASSNNVSITSDGGNHWVTSPFFTPFLEQCHSYGNGKFRIVRYGTGEVYITLDNFTTVDSTAPVFDSSIDKHWYGKILAYCTFGSGDTLLAYGSAARQGPLTDTIPGYNLIIRTTNGGKQWEKPFTFFSGNFGSIRYTTPLDQDTIVAVGDALNKLFLSFDKGATWHMDSLRLDTTYGAVHPQGLTTTADGHLLGLFTPVPFLPGPAILARGKWKHDPSRIYELVAYKTHVFPNPASTNCTVVSPVVSTLVYMHDIMGREVLRDMLSDKGELTIDLSRLANGIYTLSLDYEGVRILVDKVVIVKE
jgi:hypothetical protein